MLLATERRFVVLLVPPGTEALSCPTLTEGLVEDPESDLLLLDVAVGFCFPPLELFLSMLK